MRNPANIGRLKRGARLSAETERVIRYWRWWPGQAALEGALQATEGISERALKEELLDLEKRFRKAQAEAAGALWKRIWDIRTALAARGRSRSV